MVIDTVAEVVKECHASITGVPELAITDQNISGPNLAKLVSRLEAQKAVQEFLEREAMTVHFLPENPMETVDKKQQLWAAMRYPELVALRLLIGFRQLQSFSEAAFF
eukprot:GHVP01064563.1.p1 GENE.GHVP01064563.1~~GHVP01064563.1.p1  ORF type:complete len:107 (+),score=15.60 GHVP01064563.1:62-382(+)